MTFLKMMAHFWLVLLLVGLGAILVDASVGLMTGSLGIDLPRVAYQVVGGVAYLLIFFILVWLWYRPTWKGWWASASED